MNRFKFYFLVFLIFVNSSCGSNNPIISPKLAHNYIEYYSITVVLNTTSDWSQFAFKNKENLIFIVHSKRIIKGENAPGLIVSEIGILKESYDTTEVEVEYEIYFKNFPDEGIKLIIKKGDIGKSTILLYNTSNSPPNEQNLIGEFINDKNIANSVTNPVEFSIEKELLTKYGSEKIDVTFLGYGKKVFAFYYPWYGTPAGPAGKWNHWDPSNNYSATHAPKDGYYDSNDVTTIQRHIDLAKTAKIDGFIISWWGINSYEDNALKNFIPVAEENNFLFSIYYEDAGSLDQIVEDLGYIIQNYSTSSSFLKINNLPVIFIYSRVIGSFPSLSEWQKVKTNLKDRGFSPFLIGDSLLPNYLEVFDGLHTYNPVAFSLENIQRQYSEASFSSVLNSKLFCATVLPGYDDRIIRSPGFAVERENGNYYRSLWEIAFSSSPSWVLITSFNEWHEGTEIEPSIEYSDFYINLTAEFVEKFKK